MREERITEVVGIPEKSWEEAVRQTGHSNPRRVAGHKNVVRVCCDRSHPDRLVKRASANQWYWTLSPEQCSDTSEFELGFIRSQTD